MPQQRLLEPDLRVLERRVRPSESRVDVYVGAEELIQLLRKALLPQLAFKSFRVKP